MKSIKTLVIGALALSSTLMWGCGDAQETLSAGPEAQTVQTAKAASRMTIPAGLKVDSSRLGLVGTGGLPGRRLTQEAFESENLRDFLIGSRDEIAPQREIGDRRIVRSGGWSIESDPFKGQALLLKHTPNGPARPQDEAKLEAGSLSRLNAWGISSDEVYDVAQIRSMAQDRENDQVGAPRIEGYKTVVFRGLNGVRVEGHRAVLTHDVDGTFRRALMSWPALSERGHRLHTRLSIPEIEQRALETLASLGEREGVAILRWRYEPTRMEDGTVALTLKVLAQLPSVDRDEHTEEPEGHLIDIDAL